MITTRDLTLPASTCLLVYSGSIAYNLVTPESDIDLMGIKIAPMDEYTGLGKPDYKYTTTIKSTLPNHREVDAVIHEIKKAFKMLVSGNPNTVPLLWADPAHHFMADNEITQLIVDNRKLFNGRHFYKSFKGFVSNELKTIKLYPQPNEVKKSRKAAVHCIRMLRMLTEYLQTGRMNIRRTHDVTELMEIKCGTGSDMTKYINLINDLTCQAREAYDKSDLPDQPETDAINELLKYIINIGSK